MKELFVYYDPGYDPGCTRKFISEDVSERIVEFLRGKSFEVLQAEGLKEVMLSVVKREKPKMSIVFAQDIAPDTVLDDNAPIALIRQYLDNGGSITWVGDIPFWAQAKREGEARENDWYQSGAPANILGVNPLFARRISKVKITGTGRKTGLTATWTGIRPVLINKEIEVLAKSKCFISQAYQILPPPWLSRQFGRLRGFSVSAAGLTVDVGLKEDGRPSGGLLWNKKVANAWFKNFCADNPCSGFFRIWDYSPAVLTSRQLDDLYNVATSCMK